MKILLIEDNKEIKETTSELLEVNGFNVISTMNSNEGIELAKTTNPDIILCDIMMPEKCGYEVLKEIKGDDKISCIPFIFFSACTEPKEIEKGLTMGASSYLCKPFSEERLLKVINQSLYKV